MNANALQDRRVQLAIGGAAAVLLAVLFAVFVMRQPRHGDKGELAKAGLQVDAVHDEAKVAQTKPLRCFVNGQYVGDFTVTDCSKRNGVAAQALDVGLEGGGPPGGVAPVRAPPPVVQAPAPIARVEPPPPAAASGDCLRYVNGEWRTAGQGLSIAQCVRLLYEGRCVRPGDALYGRSGSMALRLVPGRVEASPDNRTFHTLVTQDQDCALPPA